MGHAPSRHPLAPLFNAGTVSLRCAQVLQSVRNNLSAHFRIDADALQRLAGPVQQQLLQSMPTGPAGPGNGAGSEAAARAAAPFWQHLQAGGTDRLAEFAALLAGQATTEQARAWADLACIGVLMSADPGPRWRCTEQHALPTAAFAQAQADDLLALLDRAGKTARPPAQPAGEADLPAAADGNATAGEAEAAPGAAVAAAQPVPSSAAARFSGPEGLAVAIFRAFVAGVFSSDRKQPCRADAAALRHIDVAALRALFQGSPQNTLQGLEGRATVLSRLGQVLHALPGAGATAARPADLVAELNGTSAAVPGVQAGPLLAALARKTAPLWPAPLVQGLPAGDVWPHAWAGDAVAADAQARPAADRAPGDRITSGRVPLLAQPQALVAAMAWPLACAGQPLLGLQALSACADQPTSALMMAAGVVVPRHPRLLTRSLKPGDEAVVECRALAVALFDELSAQVRAALQPAWGAAAEGLPVAKVVQATAAVLAGAGAPALRIEGDGVLL